MVSLDVSHWGRELSACMLLSSLLGMWIMCVSLVLCPLYLQSTTKGVDYNLSLAWFCSKKNHHGLNGCDLRASINAVSLPAWGMCLFQDLTSQAGLVLVIFIVFQLTPLKEKNLGMLLCPWGSQWHQSFILCYFWKGIRLQLVFWILRWIKIKNLLKLRNVNIIFSVVLIYV